MFRETKIEIHDHIEGLGCFNFSADIIFTDSSFEIFINNKSYGEFNISQNNTNKLLFGRIAALYSDFYNEYLCQQDQKIGKEIEEIEKHLQTLKNYQAFSKTLNYKHIKLTNKNIGEKTNEYKRSNLA